MKARSQRFLFLIALASLLSSAKQLVVAQESEAATGPRFISAFEKGDQFEDAGRDRFIRVMPRPPCERPSEGLRVCREDTEWQLESDLIWNDRVLYRLDDEVRAAIVVVPMGFLTSLELSQQERDALLLRHVFELGARGPLRIEAVVSDTLDWCGAVLYRSAIVADENGDRHLLHVHVTRGQYSTSFIEVTQKLRPDITASDVTGVDGSEFFDHLMPIFFVIDADPYEERPPSSRRRCKAIGHR